MSKSFHDLDAIQNASGQKVKKQLGLFRQPTFNITSDLKTALAETAEQSGLTREQILDQMNALAARYGVRLTKGNGRNLTLETLNKWLNPSEPMRMPSPRALTIFCAVVKSVAPLQVMVAPIGAKVIEGQDVKLLKWATAYHKAKHARRTMRKLEDEIE